MLTYYYWFSWLQTYWKYLVCYVTNILIIFYKCKLIEDSIFLILKIEMD